MIVSNHIAPSAAPRFAIVYTGPHYGRPHRVLHDDGRRVTVLHAPSGAVCTVSICDVETVSPGPDSPNVQ